MPCCECQEILIKLEVTTYFADVELCAYQDTEAAYPGQWYRDKTTNWSDGGNTVFDTKEGPILSGGTCSSGQTDTPPLTGDPTDVFTNPVTDYIDFQLANMEVEDGPLEYTVGGGSRDGWYALEASGFPDISSYVGQSLMATADDLFEKKEFRFKNTKYPVPIKIEWDEVTRSAQYPFDVLSTETKSVVLETFDEWSDMQTLVISEPGTKVNIEASRVYVPWKE